MGNFMVIKGKNYISHTSLFLSRDGLFRFLSRCFAKQRERERRSTTPKEARRASHRLRPPSGQTTLPASPPPPSAFASAPDARNNARKWRGEDVAGVLSSGHRSRRFLRGFAPLLVGFHPSKVVIVVVLGERKRLTGGLLYFCGGRIADGGRQPLCAAATMYGGEFGGVWWFFV
ncbi:hypothetical protein ACLB2K_030382 [Fragaria x ananassa]